MDSVINFVCENIIFEGKHIREVIIYSILSVLVWGLFPHLQYKYKIISKFFNNNMEKAADFLALLLIHIGTFRNYAFTETIFNNKRFDFGDLNIISSIVGLSILLFGSLLWITSLLKLGLRGSYFGDHFGFIFKKRIQSFPFNILENPQYSGSKLFLLGQSILFRSLTGLFMTITISLLYSFLFFVFEKKNLKKIYNKNHDNNKVIAQN
jgi:methylene-fatty-acyl-phospholipid synthase